MHVQAIDTNVALYLAMLPLAHIRNTQRRSITLFLSGKSPNDQTGFSFKDSISSSIKVFDFSGSDTSIAVRYELRITLSHESRTPSSIFLCSYFSCPITIITLISRFFFLNDAIFITRFCIYLGEFNFIIHCDNHGHDSVLKFLLLNKQHYRP